MVDWITLTQGLGLLANWHIPVVIFFGMLLGLIIGVIPGMTAALGIAVLLPITFMMDALTALILLTSVYTGSLTGGGILAILINTPGTPGAVATTFDGYPMTQKGLQNEALGLQITASVIGGFLSYLFLLFFIKPMAWVALQFGPSEMLFLTIFVLVVIGTLQGEYFSRSFFAGIFGLLLSTVGTSEATGVVRGTMGIDELEDGFPFILTIIGMFAVPEMMNLVTRQAISEKAIGKGHDLRKLMRGVRQALQYRWTNLRGTSLGVFIGLLPGAGATLASLLSYSFAKRSAKKDQQYGQGEPEGVVAAESANNASEGGSMACLLVLGIPGSAATAVILGGFMLHGLVPGPGLFRDNAPLVYGLIAGNIFQMCLLGFFALIVAFYVARVVVVPIYVLLPTLIIVVATGVFSFRNLFVDVAVLFSFGVIGYFFKRYHFTLVSFMLGLLLGKQIDMEMYRFAALFEHNPALVFNRPITLGFIALIIVTIIFQVRRTIKDRREAKADG